MQVSARDNSPVYCSSATVDESSETERSRLSNNDNIFRNDNYYVFVELKEHNN